jgi:chromosome segregation ATPase
VLRGAGETGGFSRDRDAERLRSFFSPTFLQAKLEASATLQTETEKLKNSVLAAQEEMAELQQQKAAAHEQVAGLLLEKETLEHDKQQMHAALAALQAETDALKTAAQKSDDMIVDVQHARLQACILLLI